MPPNRPTPQQSQLTISGSKSGAFSASCAKNLSSTPEIALDTISRRYAPSRVSCVLPASKKQRPNTALFDSEHYRALLLQFIVANNLPVSIVDSPALINLHKYLQENAGSVSRQTIGADLRRVYLSQVNLLKARLAATNCRFALAVDTCTSPTNSCFLAVTLQYHDESYQFQTLAIGFENLDKDSALTGASLYQCLRRVLTGYGIEDRIISITRNDDENMDNLARSYAEASQSKGLEFAGDVRSIGHVFSSLAETILDHTFFKVNETEAFRESVETTEAEHPALGTLFQGMRSLPRTIRSTISSVTRNPVLAGAFLKKVGKKEPPANAGSAVLDEMGYEWLSTFDMIDRFVFFREEITDLFQSVGSMGGHHSFDPETVSITNSQWEYLSGVHKTLSVFRSILARHHASPIPKTSQIATSVLTFLRRLNALKSEAFVVGNPLVAVGIEEVSKKVVQYYPRDADIGPMKKIYLATVLDPRFKLFPFVAEGYSARAIDDLKSYFYEEYERYEDDYKREQESTHSIVGDNGGTNTNSFGSEDFFTFTGKMTHDIDHDIEIYLSEGRVRREVDVMEYYRERKQTYPVIGRMARDYLAISPSTAPARSVSTRVSKAIRKEGNPSLPSTIKMVAILKSQGVFGDDGQIVKNSEKLARCEENNGGAGQYGVGQYLVSDQKEDLS